MTHILPDDPFFVPLDEADIEELKREEDWQRKYQRDLLQHPSCMDPDHPGCWDCWDWEDDD